jgi:hypothetical protein
VKKEVESPALHKKTMKQKFNLLQSLTNLRPLFAGGQFPIILSEWDTWPEVINSSIQRAVELYCVQLGEISIEMLVYSNIDYTIS